MTDLFYVSKKLFNFVARPNFAKTKRGASGGFLPRPLLLRLRHPNSEKKNQPKFCGILSPENCFRKTSSALFQISSSGLLSKKVRILYNEYRKNNENDTTCRSIIFLQEEGGIRKRARGTRRARRVARAGSRDFLERRRQKVLLTAFLPFPQKRNRATRQLSQHQHTHISFSTFENRISSIEIIARNNSFRIIHHAIIDHHCVAYDKLARFTL